MSRASWIASTDVEDRLVTLRGAVARSKGGSWTWLRQIYLGHPGAIAYAVPAMLAALAIQTWFRSGTVIANGDIGPPVVQGTSYLSHWNQAGDGVGGPSYNIITLPYVGFFQVLHAMGVDISTSQRIWLTLLIAVSAMAIVFFCRSLGLPSMAAGLAGIFGTFNVYRIIIASFDSVPVVALILCGFLGGLVIRAGLRQGRICREVVNDNKLDIRIGLRSDGGQALSKGPLGVAGGNDDRHSSGYRLAGLQPTITHREPPVLEAASRSR